MTILSSRVLCLIIDPTLPDLEQRVEAALSGGVNMLHIRAHQFPTRDLYELALRLQTLCQAYHVPCIVNDRLDIGLAIHANGYQLGRHSFPLPVARGIVGAEALLGASVHTLEEAAVAVQNGADWLLAGTIFPSPSHPGEPGVGVTFLRTLKQRYNSIPIIAIGGITVANINEVMAAGVDGVAVISAILQAKDVAQAARSLRSGLV